MRHVCDVESQNRKMDSMWITIIVLVYLVLLGIEDLKKRKVHVLLLGIGSVLFLGIGVGKYLLGELDWTELLLGMLPGLFLILLAWLTKKAGYADGVVLMQLGLYIGCREVLILCCCSMLFLSVISIILLFCRKVGRETQMPYLTFLAITFAVWKLSGG